MGEIPADVGPLKEPEASKKVLRVSAGYGLPKDTESTMGMLSALSSGSDERLRQEKSVLGMFERNGYIIARGGQFNQLNPHEIGIRARDEEFDENDTKRNRQIAAETGAVMPTAFSTPVDILSVGAPIVAKREGAQLGYGKYLLDTDEKKARFLTHALLGHKVFDIARRPDARAVMERLIESVRNQDFSDSLLQQGEGFFERYDYEEFIQTPSDYNTSYRIVADAFGRVQYGFLLRSGNKTGEGPPQQPDNDDYDPIDEIQYPGSDANMLLAHPSSPFYITPTKIVSNYAQGGEKIFLNGRPVLDPIERQVLTEHGIDPDNPQVPYTLSQLASKIGKACRGDYPFVGADFMQTNAATPNYYFLEANINPVIWAEGLGLDPQSHTLIDCSLEMTKRVLADS